MAKIVAGGAPHKHIEPSYDHPSAVQAWHVRWNTVVKSSCGHYYIRRYAWFAMLFPLFDHFPLWKRLRPWHIVGWLKVGYMSIAEV